MDGTDIYYAINKDDAVALIVRFHKTYLRSFDEYTSLKAELAIIKEE